MTNYTNQNWDSVMSGHYRNFTQREKIDSELFSTFSELRKLLEKKSLNHWHIHSFQQYLSNHINPFGLRIQIFPTMESIGPKFKKDWEANLSTCSNKMMLLLIDEYKTTIAQIDKELEPLYTKLSSLKTHAQYNQQDKELNEHLERFNRDVLIKKENKFLRDSRAFQEFKAYHWKNPNPRNRLYPKTKQNT